MNLYLNEKTLYIVNKKPQTVSEIEIQGIEVVLKNDDILCDGKFNLEKDVHACLFCRQLRNITFIVKQEKIFGGTLIFSEDEKMDKFLEMIKNAYPSLELSEQNTKINGYAASVVEKLQSGITVKIMETKEEEKKYCPMCGVECDPNIPYCMECGTEV